MCGYVINIASKDMCMMAIKFAGKCASSHRHATMLQHDATGMPDLYPLLSCTVWVYIIYVSSMHVCTCIYDVICMPDAGGKAIIPNHIHPTMI